MPTVLRINGYAFRLYTDDHPPPHVHVVHAGEKVVVDLDTLAIRDVVNMKSRDVLRVVEWVAENRERLIFQWNRLEQQRGESDGYPPE
jgi:hypothetical protein